MHISSALLSTVFGTISLALLLLAAGLFALESFASFPVAASGLFFLAAALIARAIPEPTRAIIAVLIALGIALAILGLIAPAFCLAGVVTIAVALVLALVDDRARSSTAS